MTPLANHVHALKNRKMTSNNPQNPGLSIDGDEFIVLMNDKKEYSLWPSGKPLPDGWQPVNFSGTKEDCKTYIDEHWLALMPMSKNDSKH